MDNPKFTIFKSHLNDQFYYHLRATNGEIILNGEGYTTKEHCHTGISSVKHNALLEHQYSKKDSAGNYTFNLKAGNGEIIGISENYTTSHGRDNGIAAVKKDAPEAPIQELS